MQAEEDRITPAKWEALVKRAVAGGNLVMAIGVKDSVNLSSTVGVDFMPVSAESVYNNKAAIESAALGFYPFLESSGQLNDVYANLLTKVSVFEDMPQLERNQLELKRQAEALGMIAHTGNTQDDMAA